MKKFIEVLKEAGIYDHIVETIVDVRNRYGAKDATKGITMILKTEMIRNPKLLDVFMDDIEDLGFKTVGAEIMKSVVDAVIIGFMANELISIVENAGLMGLPLPDAINKAIDVLTEQKEG